MFAPTLHSSIVALVSLASGIASKQPLCQLDKLRAMSIPDEQIATVIKIMHHIRDVALQKLDAAFDEKLGITLPHAAPEPEKSTIPKLKTETRSNCCFSTSSERRRC